MPIALGAVQHALELLDERLPPLRVGSAQKLLGLLPGQLETMESRADCLATAPQPDALAHPADQAAQRPARRGIGPGSGRRRGRALGGADRLAEFGFTVRAKKGRRPPVRRKASASGPPWL
jgi:hypothetical protein